MAGRSVAVRVSLERPSLGYANVLCLLVGEHCELCTKGREMKTCHLLVEGLGEQVHIVLVGLGLLKNWKETKTYKNDVYLLPKALDEK
eukprot:CAMPEP_0204533816 /NCGR_PEP_ID=MMETSP0661-20131031/12507_1 /ASSEMBLY_ACC=CAM_ASM_000606 /TAXON_ID=109239 /ORGANISM="Alexandrium margalefi, Strain AMGDE01CS-322" /LENGTH=87 /DNA_ID=CAMNT_0051540215 /DNA_START=260 /DNA_END=520 /DNA_ORIENTATION=+